MNKVINKSARLSAVILSVLLLLAASCMGLFAISASAVDGDPTPAANPKIFYYVDAGNLSVSADGTGAQAKRNSEGYPSKVKTVFMDTYGLEFGTGTDGTYVSGLYNSATDKDFGADAVTGKEWGYVKENYSWHATNPDWFVYRFYNTSSTASGFDCGRSIENTNEGPLTYKFEVDDDTTPLKIEFGTRVPGDWGTKSFNVKINNGANIAVTGTNSEDKTYSYVTLNGEQTGEAIKGVKNDDNNKFYVTLDISDSASSEGVVNWIRVMTADYTLVSVKVNYSLNQTFVQKGDTTVKTLSTEDEIAEATLDAQSIEAINSAEAFDTISISGTVDSAAVSGNITVLPRGTKYFVNMGPKLSTESAELKENASYSEAAGYGYTGTKGSDGWAGAAYDQSCVYGSNNVPFTYRFDLESGHYGVIVGTAGHWSQDRAMLASINGGAEQPLNATHDTASYELYYADIKAEDGAKSALNLTVRHNGGDNYVVTFVLVYEVNKITYDANGGVDVDPAYFDLDTEVTVAKATTRTAYDFAGWFTDKTDGTQVTANTKLYASQTLYAHWNAKQYNVSFLDEDDETVGSMTITSGNEVKESDLPSAPQQERTGYTFGWYTADTNGVKIETGTVWEYDTTVLYGLYIANDYTVTLNAGDGTLPSETENPFTVTYDEEFTLPNATAAEGYTFDGWYTDETEGTKVESGTWQIGANTTLYAHYTLNTYDVTFDSKGGSAVQKATVNHGDKASEPTAPTREGHTFGGWFTDTDCTQAFDFAAETITGDITLYAKWTPSVPSEDPNEPENPNTPEDPNEPKDPNTSEESGKQEQPEQSGGGCGSSVSTVPFAAVSLVIFAFVAVMMTKRRKNAR